jgi:hypothetical protein
MFHAARFTACNAWKCLCRDSCDCDVSKGLVAEGTLVQGTPFVNRNPAVPT